VSCEAVLELSKACVALGRICGSHLCASCCKRLEMDW
jgi:hypothetical protein